MNLEKQIEEILIKNAGEGNTVWDYFDSKTAIKQLSSLLNREEIIMGFVEWLKSKYGENSVSIGDIPLFYEKYLNSIGSIAVGNLVQYDGGKATVKGKGGTYSSGSAKSDETPENTLYEASYGKTRLDTPSSISSIKKEAIEDFVRDFIETDIYEGVNSTEEVMKIWKKQQK